MVKRRLAHDLAKLLAFKLIALAALYAAFFAPPHRARIDPVAHIGGGDALSSSTDLSKR